MYVGWYRNVFAGKKEAPALEVLSYPADKPVTDTPLLFIHGAYAGAWCWEEHFLPYFSAQGYHCHAVSVRGHGRSEGGERLHGFSLNDYVQDVTRTMDSLPKTPVLIGHSMGGMIIQKLLERMSLPAAVLMASVPPYGLGQSSINLLLGDPLLVNQLSMMQWMGPAMADVRIAKRAILSDDFPDERLLSFANYFQPESLRAIWDMHLGNLPRLWRIHPTPLLVLGAENDALFRPAEVRRTADTYGEEAEIFPNMAHAMMLERGWEQVAARIADWLGGQRFG